VIWEADRGWYVTPPFNEPEVFDFPGGIGPVECVNVEHEELLGDGADEQLVRVPSNSGRVWP
jgi:hypothetical protein